MNPSRWLLLCASLALSSAALARPPNLNQVNGSMLGQVDALINFCSQANPSSAKSYDAIGDRMTPGLRRDDIEDARHTRSYRESYDAVHSMLEVIPRQLRAEACSRLVAPQS